MKVEVTQFCLTLCNPMDCTVHGILQARILEWVAVLFFRVSSQPRDWIRSPALQVDSLPDEPPGKPRNTGMGSLSLLQRILLTQELNRGLLHCRWILYQLIHKGNLNKPKQATRQILTRTKWSVLTHTMTHFLMAIWRILRGCCCNSNYAYLA